MGSPLNVSYAELFRFMLQFLCLQMCVYGGSAVPQGGVGDRHLVTVPQGWWGTVFPGVGNDKGRGGYANYWAPLTRKRDTMPHSAQPQHTNYWAPRTRKRHQQEHRSQRPTESSNPTLHVKGRTGDCPGPRKGATTRRNVTRGGGGGGVTGRRPLRLPWTAAAT